MILNPFCIFIKTFILYMYSNIVVLLEDSLEYFAIAISTINRKFIFYKL